SSSGPRCPIAPAIARTRASASVLRVTNTTPQIPHTLLFNLRRSEECSAGPRNMFAQMESPDLQLAVGIPGQRPPHRQKKYRTCDEQAQHQELFPLQQQG